MAPLVPKKTGQPILLIESKNTDELEGEINRLIASGYMLRDLFVRGDNVLVAVMAKTPHVGEVS